MAFPTTTVLDSGEGGNGTLDSGSWRTLVQVGTPLTRASNQLAGQLGSGYSGSAWSAATFGPDVEVYATLAAGSGGYFDLQFRIDDPSVAADNGYGIYFDVEAGTAAFYLIADGEVAHDLGPGEISCPISVGDRVGVQIIDDAMQIWRQPADGSWATVGDPVTDSTYTGTGSIALLIYGTSIRLTDFGGGTVVSSVGLTGSIDLAIAPSGAPEASAAITGTIPAAITPSGVLAAQVALTGTVAVNVVPSGSLRGAGDHGAVADVRVPTRARVMPHEARCRVRPCITRAQVMPHLTRAHVRPHSTRARIRHGNT